MIDKSIRQYYQNGKKAGPFKRGIKTIWDPIKKKYIDPLVDTTTGKLDKKLVAETIPEVAEFAGKSFLKREAAKKLGLTSLNPLLGLLSLVMPWIKDKWGKEGAFQAFTSGIMGPEWADLGSRELRQLEKRRDYMLRRKADNKTYSKKNLEEVTNQIKEIKKTRNVIEEVTADDSFAWPEPTGGDEISVGYEEGQVDPNLARHIPKDSPISQFPGEDEIIQRQRDEAAKRKEESDAMVAKEIAAAEAFRIDQEKQQRLKEQAAAYAAEQTAQAAALPPQLGGDPEGQGQPSPGAGQPQTGGGGFERGDYGGRGYHWKKGGRVDKALGGRSRDI